MADFYTSRQVIDGAAKWGIGVDESEGGPGRVGLIYTTAPDNRRHLLAIIPSPLNLTPNIRKHGDLMRGLMAFVRVGHPDQFLYGPVMEARPMQQPKEQTMSVEPEVTPGGYVPMVNRPPLPITGRPNSISTVIEQVLCSMDRPATAREVYEEVVKYVPYAGLTNVKASLNNLNNGAVGGGYVKRFDYVPNPDYGKVPKSMQQVARFTVDPPFRVDVADIPRLPDWRPTKQENRPRPVTGKKKEAATKHKPATLKEQQRKAAEKRAKDAQRKARQRAEAKLHDRNSPLYGTPLTNLEAATLKGRMGYEEAVASTALDGETQSVGVPTPVEPHVSAASNGQATFTAVARTLEDPDVIILKDDEGNWWEARLSERSDTYQ